MMKRAEDPVWPEEHDFPFTGNAMSFEFESLPTSRTFRAGLQLTRLKPAPGRIAKVLFGC